MKVSRELPIINLNHPSFLWLSVGGLSLWEAFFWKAFSPQTFLFFCEYFPGDYPPPLPEVCRPGFQLFLFFRRFPLPFRVIFPVSMYSSFNSRESPFTVDFAGYFPPSRAWFLAKLDVLLSFQIFRSPPLFVRIPLLRKIPQRRPPNQAPPPPTPLFFFFFSKKPLHPSSPCC